MSPVAVALVLSPPNPRAKVPPVAPVRVTVWISSIRGTTSPPNALTKETPVTSFEPLRVRLNSLIRRFPGSGTSKWPLTGLTVGEEPWFDCPARAANWPAPPPLAPAAQQVAKLQHGSSSFGAARLTFHPNAPWNCPVAE